MNEIPNNFSSEQISRQNSFTAPVPLMQTASSCFMVFVQLALHATEFRHAVDDFFGILYIRINPSLFELSVYKANVKME